MPLCGEVCKVEQDSALQRGYILFLYKYFKSSALSYQDEGATFCVQCKILVFLRHGDYNKDIGFLNIVQLMLTSKMGGGAFSFCLSQYQIMYQNN